MYLESHWALRYVNFIENMKRKTSICPYISCCLIETVVLCICEKEHGDAMRY